MERKDLTGTDVLVMQGVSVGKGFGRTVDKRLRNWFTAQNQTVCGWQPMEYRVIFEQEAPQLFVSCRIEIRSELGTWHSLEVAKNAQAAFERCLQHMTSD